MKTIRKPWKDQSIHIVGEAYSNEPGWVEGAFQTTELLLQEEFKLPELVKDYYAGYWSSNPNYPINEGSIELLTFLTILLRGIKVPCLSNSKETIKNC